LTAVFSLVNLDHDGQIELFMECAIFNIDFHQIELNIKKIKELAHIRIR